MLGVFLDTETNGLDWSKHVILEISFVIKNLTTGKEIDSYEAMITPTDEEWQRSDIDSLNFTGITKETLVKDGIKKTLVQQDILDIFKKNSIERGNAVFICQNPSFDRIFFSSLIEVETQERLKLPYYWLDLASMYWSKRISEKANSYNFSISKDSIAKHYQLPDEEKPHRATQGARHLITCYNAVVGFPEKDSLKHV